MKELTQQDIENIRNNPDKQDWYNICRFQNLSEAFIREFQDRVILA